MKKTPTLGMTLREALADADLDSTNFVLAASARTDGKLIVRAQLAEHLVEPVRAVINDSLTRIATGK